MKAAGKGGFVLGLLSLSLLAAAVVSVWADSSGTAPPAPREWRDESGRLLKRTDSWGRSTFYSHDQLGRLVRVDCDKDAWTHCFLYGADGQGVVAEVDCMGSHHEFPDPREIDLKSGTALSAHRHVPPPRSTPQPVPPSRETRVEYDTSSRLTSLEKN